MDTTVDASMSAPTPSAVADALANGDQRIPLETRRQMEAVNSPLQLEVIAKEDNKEDGKEKEQKDTQQAQGVDGDLEKMRIDFELTVLKHQHEENEKQRQHEEKMELMKQQTPSRTLSRGEEEQLGSRLDPITEIELEKMRMEFELAKLKHISEENERQRQHEQKTYEDKEKQRQHEEKMEQMRQRQGLLRASNQKASSDCKVEAMSETASAAFAEVGKVRIEVQLAMQVYLPEMNEKKSPCEQSGCKEIPNLEQQGKSSPEDGKPQVPPAQQEADGVTEHLGLRVPRIVVSGAEPVWSASRLDLAIETELEKRRMEFELTRLKYEHEDNERQRQHEEKMEQLRQQALPREEDNLENASSAPDNQTEPTSALDDLTEPPCTPNDMTDTLDIRDEEVHMRAKPQAAVDNLHPGLATTEGEMDSWVHMEQPRNKQAHALATQLEKMRLDMELTMTRYRYEDKEKQREHEEKMEELRLQVPETPPLRGGHHHHLLPQDQYTLILYCFIFMHLICIARELMFFLIKKHDIIAISILIMCAIKMFWK
ncbi:uncharacterized protein LOC143823240 [Paroedura picta]|uniref:uncharacterized protein LOC143823240 n=1 Tax=Paroedura picta TaxID=143630 RepID=UPI0040575D51